MIWWCRNKLVHDGTSVDVLVLANSINKLSLAHSEEWKSKIPFGSLIWRPPPPNVIKINSDVAIPADFAVLAVVFRDSQGVVLGAQAEKINVGSVVEGEALAIKMGASEASKRQ